MSWTDRFDVAATALGTAWGAAVNLATSPFDDDEESFAEILGSIGQLGIGAVNSVAQVGLGVGGGALEGANWLSENLVLEPLSTAVTAASLADSKTWNKGLLNGATWSKARDIAQYRSFGQSVGLMYSTDDVLAEEKHIQELQDSFLFNAVSGTIDGLANVFLDPTIIGGKIATAGKIVSKGFGAGHRAGDPLLQRLIAKTGRIGVGDIDPYDYAQSQAVTDFLAWSQNKSGRQIANHPAVAKSPYRSVVAGLLQQADPATGRLIIAVGYGSKRALGELAARRDDLAMRVARADNNVNFALQHEVSRTWRDRMPAPPLRSLPGARPGLKAKQETLFGFGRPPIAEPTSMPVRPTRPLPYMGPPGAPVSYPSISGNIPPPISADGAAELIPYLRSAARERGALRWDQLPELGKMPRTVRRTDEWTRRALPRPTELGWEKGTPGAGKQWRARPWFKQDKKDRANPSWMQDAVPDLPPAKGWREATDWKMHQATLDQPPMADLQWNEKMSMRILPGDRTSTRWFLSMQRELLQASGKELELLTAAVGGGGGEGRGVWNSMINQVITPGDRQAMRADRALAYDWDSRSLVAERVIQPKAFGQPVRVIQEFPFHIARAFSEKRPPSWIDPNRGDSHAPYAAFLNSIDVFPPVQKEQLLRQYMATFEPGAKHEMVVRTEASAIRAMAIKYGLSAAAAEMIAKESVGQRNSVIAQLRKPKSQRYAADVQLTPERFPYEDFPVDDDIIPVVSPIFETQETNSIPLLDLDKYDLAFRRHSEALSAFDRGAATAQEFAAKAYDVFNPLWSFSVLMRLGYTVRTISDDMLRIWSSLGAMSIMGNIHAGARNMLTADGSWKTFAPSKGALGQRARNAKVGLKRVAVGAMAFRTPKDVAAMIRAEVDTMGRDLESVRTINDLGFESLGRTMLGPYEGRGGVYRQIVGGSYDAVARTSAEIMERLRSDYASWEVKNPGDADHLDSWAYAINHQILKSAIGRKYLEGATGAEVEHWLRYTAEGIQVRKKTGAMGRDPQRLAGMVQATVDQYVPILRQNPDKNGPQIDTMVWRRAALEGRLDAKLLEEAFPDVLSRPQVHGPSVDMGLFQGPTHGYIDSIVSTGFRWLSQIPSDKLMRHPTFRTLYMDSVRKQHISLVKQLGDEAAVTGDDLRSMEHVARESALKGVNDLLYDVGTKSNAAHLMRFVTSFFSAWEDSITKWSRLAMDKPQLLFIGSKIYESPNEMNFGMTEDEAGNRVPRIQVVDSQGKRVKPEDATIDGMQRVQEVDAQGKPIEGVYSITYNNERIIARLPEWIKKVIPGAEEFGSAAIPKSSLNLILQGNPWWLPGAGPLTQIAVSEIAKDQPSIKNVYEWAIPYSAQGITDVLLPGWAKQAIKGNQGLDDPAYAYIYVQIAQTEEMRIRQGTRTRPAKPIDFAAEITRRTDAAFKIRSFTRFFLPFTADLQSPYQFYIDQYRQLADVHGDKADELFYERYGDDLYLFTTALSKNNIGLKASDKAWRASHEYADLIAANPEYGALIVGPDNNAGPFNQYIHDAQFAQNVSPGSLLTARSRRSPMEALADTDRKAGWIMYGKYMAEMRTLQETGRYSEKQLEAGRKWIADTVGERHAEWLSDFHESDRAAIPNRIKLFESLVKEPKLMNNPLRTDIRVLATYLQVRREFLDRLAALKAAHRPYTLEADTNKDLAKQWQNFQDALAASDTRFGDLHARYLSNDRLQVV